MTEKKRTFFVGCDLRRFDRAPGKISPYLGKLAAWPPHITLLPPVTELEDRLPDDVFGEFAEIAKRTQPIRVRPVREVYFDAETPVTVIEDLRVLHYALVGVLHAYGYDGRYPEAFAGRGYNAHTSHLDGSIIPVENRTLDSMTIFRRSGDTMLAAQRLEFEGRS